MLLMKHPYSTVHATQAFPMTNFHERGQWDMTEHLPWDNIL